MSNIMHMLERLSYEDLARIEKEMASGALRKDVQHRMLVIEKKNMKVCPVCGGNIVVTQKGHYALDFGPAGLRKRAHFDGIDCLEFFIAKLKDYKRGGSV